MNDPHLHNLYSVVDYHNSESAVVYLPLINEDGVSIAIKRLKAYKDKRYNLLTPAKRQACQLEAYFWNRIFNSGMTGAFEIYMGLALLCREHTTEENEIPPQSVCLGPIFDPMNETLISDKDYVLVMKYLPDSWRLDNIIKEHENDLGELWNQIMPLIEHVAHLYIDATTNLTQKESIRWGKAEQLRRKLAQNLQLLKMALKEQRMSHKSYQLLRSELQKILKKTTYTDNFQKRIEAGFIRRCHGDLKAPNIWIAPTEELARKYISGIRGESTEQKAKNFIWLLDAIDFNLSYCNIDVLSDFALLVVDIHARTGSEELANEMINYYLSRTEQEDHIARAVLAYYLVEKSIMSAAVSIKFDNNIALGEAYLRIAELRLKALQLASGQSQLITCIFSSH